MKSIAVIFGRTPTPSHLTVRHAAEFRKAQDEDNNVEAVVNRFGHEGVSSLSFLLSMTAE